MPMCASKTRQHKSYWAQQLFHCIEEMAQLNTNAVLLTLADVDVVESGRSYPDEGLMFANKRWRAFYHCHEAATQHENEHGHFHIFTEIGEQEWAHAAGLAIDDSGQPLHWFAVNRWVTDGPWLDRVQFIQQLQATTDNEQDSLAGRWLFALLRLHQSELIDMFQSRDKQLRSHPDHLQHAVALEDRNIYTLAIEKIELQAMLEKNLLH